MCNEYKWEKAEPPTDEEMLEEAKAWGFDTVEEWLAAMDEAWERGGV